MAAAISGAAFLIAGLDSAVRALGNYARLHHRLAERTEAAGGRP
jgi:hypothetical protein